MILGLVGGADGAGNGDQPQRDEYARAGNLRPVAPAQAAVEHGGEAGEEGGEHQHEQLRLQAAAGEQALDAPRQQHQLHLAVFEQALAVETLHHRRVGEAAQAQLLAQ